METPGKTITANCSHRILRMLPATDLPYTTSSFVRVPCAGPVCSTVWPFSEHWGLSGNQPTGIRVLDRALHYCCLLAAIYLSLASTEGHTPEAPHPFGKRKTIMKALWSKSVNRILRHVLDTRKLPQPAMITHAPWHIQKRGRRGV